MKAYLFAFLAIFLWGTSAAVGKLLLTDLDNLQVLLVSSLLALVSLFVISLFTKKLEVIKKYKRRDYLIFAGMGGVGVFLYYYFFYGALALMPAQDAFVINYLWPIMVVLFSIILLKEKLTIRKALGLVVSFLGVAVVITKGDIVGFNSNNPQGILFALAGAVSYGIFSVLVKKLKYEEFTSTMFYYIFAFIYVLIFTLGVSSIPAIGLPQLVGLLWLGVFCSGLAFVFWFLALKYGDTAKVSNLIFLTPFLSLVFIYFLVGEEILLPSIVGLAIIVLGILIQSFSLKNKS